MKQSSQKGNSLSSSRWIHFHFKLWIIISFFICCCETKHVRDEPQIHKIRNRYRIKQYDLGVPRWKRCERRTKDVNKTALWWVAIPFLESHERNCILSDQSMNSQRPKVSRNGKYFPHRSNPSQRYLTYNSTFALTVKPCFFWRFEPIQITRSTQVYDRSHLYIVSSTTQSSFITHYLSRLWTWLQESTEMLEMSSK